MNSFFSKISLKISSKVYHKIFLLIFCIFISLILSQFLFIKNNIEGFTESNEYFTDVSENLFKLEEIYNDTHDGIKYEYTISDQYKKEKMTNDISNNMSNWGDYTYKSDLEKIIKDESITDDSVILKNTKTRIDTIRDEIKEKPTEETK